MARFGLWSLAAFVSIAQENHKSLQLKEYQQRALETIRGYLELLAT
jgi:hypothetical protein